MGARDAHFFVDGGALADLSNGGYTQTYLPEGTHQVMQRWNENNAVGILFGVSSKTLEVPIDVKAGNVYYLRFATGVGDISPQVMTLTWQLEWVNPAQGSTEITQTNYQPAKL